MPRLGTLCAYVRGSRQDTGLQFLPARYCATVSDGIGADFGWRRPAQDTVWLLPGVADRAYGGIVTTSSCGDRVRPAMKGVADQSESKRVTTNGDCVVNSSLADSSGK